MPAPAPRHRLLPLTLAATLLLAPHASRAAIEDEAAPEGAPVTTGWYDLQFRAPGAPTVDPATAKADRDYLAGMRPHHAGALSMAREYLDDPQSSSLVLRQLARAIIVNQSFEIRAMDEVERRLSQPARILDLGFTRLVVRPTATEGLLESERFFRAPIPTRAAAVVAPFVPVTARDVQFAKAMTIHHQAALDMARGYNANPAARNNYLRLLNVDIVTDQSQEIALMRNVIATYPGDADAVRVDASMIHGMEGMGHGGHGATAPGADQGAMDHGGMNHGDMDHGAAGRDGAGHDGAGHGQPDAAQPTAAPATSMPRRAVTPHHHH
ncbi:DUF305 domain-containing protein [Roseomonas sp. NAR14]|uniref:DUF305 domain-containing protein n=1 Tax=Roseomonas acroporae TaxID=2937791 RepID=A0A9X1Y729_9PROT|nr:DUF305 domain-containing protein [Roseomonas acroporae]MCK8783410.1 DUF305 domain-containing protein [Roseomonas acroporae]